MSAACGLCERALEDGYLCPGDTLALAERLERMPKLYAALAGFLTPAARGSGERVSTSRTDPGLPVDEVGPSLARATAKVTKNPAGGGQRQAPADDPWNNAKPAGGQQQPAAQGAGYSDEPPF